MNTFRSDNRSVAEMIRAWDDEDAQDGTIIVQEKQFKGRHQEPRTMDDLDLIDFESDDPLPIVGRDNRVYEPRHGLIECLAAAKLDKKGPDVYVKTIDWSRFPPESELSYLYETFFKKYDREVLMLVGWRRDGSGCRYHVPKQEGTSALVIWQATDEEMGQFQEECHWVGTIHVHPGDCSAPSQTDIDDWAIPEKSGLHLIFARDGSYTIHGAIAGRTFQVGSGTVVDTLPVKGYITTSQGRPIEDLLTEPKPIVRTPRKGWSGPSQAFTVSTKSWTRPAKSITLPSKLVGTWTESLEAVEALSVEYEDVGDLSVVMTAVSMHILTPGQWVEFVAFCKEDGCALPTRHTLSLKGGGL